MSKKCLAVVVLLCLCLVACGKEKKVAETSEVSVTEESTEDPFAVEHEFNLDGTETVETTEDAEAQEIESIQAEYVYTDPESGKDVDIRDSNGMAGLLAYVADVGGVEALKERNREDLAVFLKVQYFEATEEEIDSVLEAVYGENTEKKAQLEDAMEEQSKADSGLVYTDEGWKDVYKETNGNSYYEISEDAEGGFTPLDPALEGITIYSY